MKTEVNSFFAPWTRNGFPLILNGVLENTWFKHKKSSKLAHGILRLCFATQLLRFFWDALDFFHLNKLL